MDRDERQRIRAERYRVLSQKAAQKAEEAYQRSKSMSDAIPMGQPVHGLADRKYRDKIWNTMGQSVRHSEKAGYWAEKASSVENNTSIYLDDDNAVEKLESKLRELERVQETMKAANKIIRSKKISEIEKYDKLVELGLTESQVKKLFVPNCFGEIGFASCSITNNGANIRRVKQQLEKARLMKSMENKEYSIGEINVVENYSENRIQLFFDGKPDKATRNELKRNGFRWSGYNGCWQAYINNSSRSFIKKIRENEGIQV